MIWVPDSMPKEEEPYWNEKANFADLQLGTVPGLKVLVTKYPQRIKDGDSANVLVVDDCARVENSIKMMVTCNGMFWVFQAPAYSIALLDNRYRIRYCTRPLYL